MPAAFALVLGLAAIDPPPPPPERSIPSTLIIPGLLFSTGWQGRDFGLEVSAVHWPNYREPFLYGAFGQAELGSRAPRFAGGVEVGYSAFGVELGYAHRSAGDGYVASSGVQVAPYFSLGFLNLGVRYTRLSSEGGGWGSEVAFVISVKAWFPLAGRYPDPIHLAVPHGRPLRDEAGLALPAPRASGPAGEWLARGESEQISVATFLRLRAELAAHDAPDDLLSACSTAALDEIGHARACFAIAERLGHARVVPGDLHVPPARTIGLVELALESLHDGFVGEGLAAASLAREAGPDVLRDLAREEQTHAELGLRIVAFALERGGAPVARAVEAALADLPAEGALRVRALLESSGAQVAPAPAPC